MASHVQRAGWIHSTEKDSHGSCLHVICVNLKKEAQHESFELQFCFGTLLRIIA